MLNRCTASNVTPVPWERQTSAPGDLRRSGWVGGLSLGSGLGSGAGFSGRLGLGEPALEELPGFGVAQVEAADRWGLDAIWLAEIHQQARRSVLTAPLTVASAIAARTRRIKIGIHGSPWTCEEARTRAIELMRGLALGVDPLSARAEAKIQFTVKQLGELYLMEGPARKPDKKKSSWDTDR